MNAGSNLRRARPALLGPFILSGLCALGEICSKWGQLLTLDARRVPQGQRRFMGRDSSWIPAFAGMTKEVVCEAHPAPFALAPFPPFPPFAPSPFGFSGKN